MPTKRHGIHYSLGYSGYGVQMATYMGKQMARRMLGLSSSNVSEDLPTRLGCSPRRSSVR